MKKIFFLMVSFCLFIGGNLFAQQQIEPGNVWKLESAGINLLERGGSELVHELTTEELSERMIPELIRFTDPVVNLTVGDLKTTSEYIFDKGELRFKIGDQFYTYTAWFYGKDQLILIAEYSGTDYRGNELRITYRKENN